MPDRDESTAPDDAAAQRGAPQDATGKHDISYYRQSALARLMTAEAARRARKARREALLLLPVVAGLIVLWVYREELFGTDVPIRIATALAHSAPAHQVRTHAARPRRPADAHRGRCQQQRPSLRQQRLR